MSTPQVNIDLPPTPHELDILASCIRLGDERQAADHLGLALSTVRNALSGLYSRLDVRGQMAAAFALGWVHIPAGPLIPSGRRPVNGAVSHDGSRRPRT